MKKKSQKSARYTKPNWTHQRIRRATHEQLVQLSAHTHITMSALVEISVDHSDVAVVASAFRRMLNMDKLTYFVLYIDEKPQFLVAAKDKDAAESGMRQSMLGQTFKSLKAVSAMDAKFEDFVRVGLLASMNQVTQLNAILAQAAAASAGAGPHLVGPRGR